MNYLQSAKDAMNMYLDADEEVASLYAREIQVTSLLSIAEQLTRIADAIEKRRFGQTITILEDD